MRLNIYAEELTDRFEIVERVPSTGHTDQKFYGLRFYLKSPPELHADPEDDDTSAVTIWFSDRGALSDWVERVADFRW